MKMNGSVRNIPFVLAAILLFSAIALAQAPVRTYAPPKTPWGDPDLQGLYTNATVTPFERPAEFAGKEFLTEKEVAAVEARAASNNVDQAPRAGDPGTYNQFWFERGSKVVPTRRSSLIIDPPDGRFPALTATAQKWLTEHAGRGNSPIGTKIDRFDAPEDRPLSERCLWWANAGPPIFPTVYNNNYRIMQAPGYVVILSEMIHDVRIIPLDGRPHLHQNVRQYLGDSRGHWEGDTLVVESSNFNEQTKLEFGRPPFNSIRGIGDNARVTERFTRTSPEVVNYRFTVDDPVTYTRPFTAESPWIKTDTAIFEYACQEGNYALPNVLSGARAAEKNAH